MSTFVPSEHSNNYGDPYGDLLSDQEGLISWEPLDDFGVFIAETNGDEGPSAIGQVIGLGTMVAGGYAAALSYRRNQSILWAGLSWFGWPIALPYMLMTPKEPKE